MLHTSSSLPATLQRARKARRISQLELAMQLGVSQRHVSFVESGRSRPSRELLLAWLRVLDTPLAFGNEACLLAGYAPAYSTRQLGDPALAETEQALEHLLRANEATPAMVLDADWNVLRANRAALWLTATLLPGTTALNSNLPINLLDLLTHPDGLTQHVLNLEEVGPAFLTLLRDHASAHPPLMRHVDAYTDLLRARLGEGAVMKAIGRLQTPVLTTRFASPYGELAFFSMFTTFGTPHDITLESLRVEHMFPADAATREVLSQLASR